MKRTFFALTMILAMLAITGCGGGGDNSPPLFVKLILSDATVDGDIGVDPLTGSVTVTQVTRDRVSSVLAGVDPVTREEFRAFLDFPLAGIPLNAIIDSATLDIRINSIQQTNGTSIPIRIELVSFPPPLLGSDFDRVLLQPLATTTILPPISLADVNHHVVIDVTALMREAQARGLANFQIRILEDFGFVSPGLIHIDDTTNASAPLLRVAFF